MENGKSLLIGDEASNENIKKLNNNNSQTLLDVNLAVKPKKEASACRLLIVFIGCCVIHFLVFGMHYSFGVIFASLLETFDAGQGQTAWVGSLASGALFFWSMLAVKMCDITSVTFTCLFGSILSGVGLMLTSIVQQFNYLYLTHSFLFGLGTSLMYTPSLVVIAHWFGKWKSAATGFVVASGSLGQVVLSPLLQYIVKLQGVLITFRWWGSLFLILSVMSALTFFLLDSRCTPDPTEQKTAKYQLNWRLFKDKAYIIWVLIMMITNFTYYIPLIHLSYYSEHLGASPQRSSLLLTGIASSSIVGRVVFGKISNFKPCHTLSVYQLAMFCSGLSTLFFSLSTKFWHLIIYSLIYGFLDGSFIGLMSIVTMQIVGLQDVAQGWGLMLFSIATPIALGPPTVGWMNESNSIDGRALFYLSGVPMVVGSFLMILIKRWKREDTKSHLEIENGETSIMLQVITVL